MIGALVTLAATWENPKKLVIRPLVLTTASKPVYETERILDVEVDDGKPWYHDIQRYLEHGEFSEGVSGKDMKLGNKTMRLPDLERNESTESIDVSRLKLHFA